MTSLVGGLGGLLLGCALVKAEQYGRRRRRAAYWLARVDEVTALARMKP